jgi:hypothetical protein
MARSNSKASQRRPLCFADSVRRRLLGIRLALAGADQHVRSKGYAPLAFPPGIT